MRTYIRLFMTLLLPLSILFTVASMIYFTFNYDFSKAIKLGVLSGVLIAISTSLVIALMLLLLRKMQSNESVQDNEPMKSADHSEAVPIPIHKVVQDHKQTREKPTRGVSNEIKCMLLMDRELTFEVILSAIKKENDCALSASDPKKGTMTIQTQEGIIQTTITSLTQHTSQIILLTQNNARQVKKLISHIKEKELSFLQY